MYTIFINDTPLILSSSSDVEQPVVSEKDILVMPYTGKEKMLLNYADMLEKNSRYQYVKLHYTDHEQLFLGFKKHYKIVPAAGGVVYNGAEQVLFIYRLNHWDLPKGKIETNESPAAAAIREVQEETGLKHLTLGKELPLTYHTYKDKKGRRVLKPTYWYEMHTTETILIPQLEENIELAEWHTIEEILAAEQPIYNSLSWLLKQC